MISFDKVSKFIVRDVSIHIPKGKAVGLIGVSGSGKTTFLKLACGLLKPGTGQIYTLGHSPCKCRKEIGRRAGVFFTQHPMLDAEDTVEGNFKALQIIYGIACGEFEKRYRSLSEQLGFHHYKKETVKNLSLGQRRRAELGAVFLKNPGLLLLDEPANGLDGEGREAFFRLAKEYQKKGATIVISSHNMEEISKLCDRIILLHQGKVGFYGEREMLLKKFAPMDTMTVWLSGKMPDMGDLPLHCYTLAKDLLTITYNSNYITAAELLQHILQQTGVDNVSIHKSNLTDGVAELEHML